MQNYHQPLLPSECYHLFSRAVGSEKLFVEPKNYSFFLDKLNFHTKHVASIFSYSLLPNHFHLVVRIRSAEDIISHFEVIKNKKFDLVVHNISDFIMERFSNFLNCYTKSFNKIYNRKGALFIDYLKRSVVEKDSDLISFIFYTHKNALHHGYTNKMGAWWYDSYNIILINEPTHLLRNEVLNVFGGKDRFVQYHEQPVDRKPIRF